MADVVERQFIDVESFTQGGNVYLGIQQVTLRFVRGRLIMIRKEGEVRPSAMELVGTDEAPVSLNIQHNSVPSVLALSEETGDVTFLARDGGESAKRLVTITAVQWEEGSAQAIRDGKGNGTLSGKGLSWSEAAPA